MLKQLLKITAAFGLVLAAGNAFAQSATGSGSTGAGNGPIVDITVRGTVTSAVTLNITGSGGSVLSATTSATSPAIAVGTLDFGSFSTLSPTTATNTTFSGRTALNDGAILAGSLAATLTYNGASTGSLGIARKVAAGGAGDIPLTNLRVASPALASWTASTDGVQVPNFGAAAFNICTAVGDATCINAKSYVHQLAVYVPDTQATGLFSTVIEYVGTAP